MLTFSQNDLIMTFLRAKVNSITSPLETVRLKGLPPIAAPCYISLRNHRSTKTRALKLTENMKHQKLVLSRMQSKQWSIMWFYPDFNPGVGLTSE